MLLQFIYYYLFLLLPFSSEIFQSFQEETLHVCLLGSIFDLFQSINTFALLGILSEETDDGSIAKYYLATASRFGNRR